MTTIDKILICCAVFMVLFVITNIILFIIIGSTPDVLIENVFSLFTSEIVLTFVIWAIKKHKDKKPRE